MNKRAEALQKIANLTIVVDSYSCSSSIPDRHQLIDLLQMIRREALRGLKEPEFEDTFDEEIKMRIVEAFQKAREQE